jgi:4-amino-4-deoxyprephenate dehydrogenase
MKSAGSPAAALRRCVVVGNGAVGGMFAALLRQSGATVCVIDQRAPAEEPAVTGRFVCGDISALSDVMLAELGQADLVLLAVAEQVALAAVPAVTLGMRPGALLAHTLSVQSRAAAALRAAARPVEALGLNPLFAPSLGLAGRPVAAIVIQDGPRTAQFLRLVSAWGGHVVLMDAARHDRLAAFTQALTHATVIAFGLALGQWDGEIRELAEIAPPPHTMLLALLARITGGAPEVYWDVQTGNPHGREVVEALSLGIQQLSELTTSGTEVAFAQALHDLGRLLAGKHDWYARLCAQVFGQLPSLTSDQRDDSLAAPDGNELSGLRAQLDVIDNRLLDTLRDRIACCSRIALYKWAHDVPMMQPHRVAAVQKVAGRYAHDHGLSGTFLHQLYEMIIAETCRIEDLIISDAKARSSRSSASPD